MVTEAKTGTVYTTDIITILFFPLLRFHNLPIWQLPVLYVTEHFLTASPQNMLHFSRRHLSLRVVSRATQNNLSYKIQHKHWITEMQKAVNRVRSKTITL